jgi:type VI secretion system protein ImpH
VNTIAGNRVWDSQSKFRLRVGPLALEQLKDFVPQGSAFRPAKELLQLLTGSELDFDLQLIIKREEVPTCRLGGTTDGPRLGWTSWLKTREFVADDDQVVLVVREDSYQH